MRMAGDASDTGNSGGVTGSKQLWYRATEKARVTLRPTRPHRRSNRRPGARACPGHPRSTALARTPPPRRRPAADADAGPERPGTGPGRTAPAGHRLVGRRAAHAGAPGGIRRDDAEVGRAA